MYVCGWVERDSGIDVRGEPCATAWGAFVDVVRQLGVSDPQDLRELFSVWLELVTEIEDGADFAEVELIPDDMSFQSGRLFLRSVGV